jgi:hypothetical protein
VQRFRLDLANPLARDSKATADLLKSSLLPIDDSVAKLHDPPLPTIQRVEGFIKSEAQRCSEGPV